MILDLNPKILFEKMDFWIFGARLDHAYIFSTRTWKRCLFSSEYIAENFAHGFARNFQYDILIFDI